MTTERLREFVDELHEAYARNAWNLNEHFHLGPLLHGAEQYLAYRERCEELARKSQERCERIVESRR